MCQSLNLDDNKNQIKKLVKAGGTEQPWMKKYQATSRTIWRNVWFFEFLGILFINIEADRKSLASACARDAYDKALKPHHPWLLAKAAGVAMKAVNYREVCVKNICDE